MAEQFAPEYTAEMSKPYLDSLLAPIDEFSRVDEGRATAEAASRGLTGQAFEGSLIGQSRANVAREKTRTIGYFNMDVANKKREERLKKTDMDFSATERQKDRDQQEKLAQLGYEYGDASARRDNIYGQQGAVVGGLLSLASSAVGGYTGGLGRRA